PSLIPAAIVMLVVGILMRPQSTPKLLATSIVTLVLFAPKLLGALAAGRFAEVLTDPGTPLGYTPATLGELVLGFPVSGFGVIETVLASITSAEEIASWIIVGSFLVPLGI